MPSAAAAEELLADAPLGGWLLCFYQGNNQNLVFKKRSDGHVSVYASFKEDPPKDSTLDEMMKRYTLDLKKVVRPGAKTAPSQQPTPSTAPPPSGAEPTPAATGLSAGQQALRELPSNHGDMASADAERLLADAPAGSWLLRFSKKYNQSIVSIKKDDGGISHFSSFKKDPPADLTLNEILKRYSLAPHKVVRPGDNPALQEARAQIQQLLYRCDAALTNIGPGLDDEIKVIQGELEKALKETDATKVLSLYESAQREYDDVVNRSNETAKTKLKTDIFLEKNEWDKLATPADLVRDARCIDKVATAHGISQQEAKKLLMAVLDELVDETEALIPTGFVKPLGKHNTINSLAPEQSRPKLTLEEAQAVFGYSRSDYKQINQPLWSNTVPPPPHDKTHKLMQDAFAKTKPFDDPLKVTRGVKFTPGPDTDEFLKPFRDAAGTDALVPLTGYISTGTAGTPQDFDGNIEFVILAKQALDLTPYSQFPEEKELLLNHNTPVKVHSCTQSGGKWTVTVEQILPVVS
jgi:ADP-ribosyltransferase exoenzyme